MKKAVVLFGILFLVLTGCGSTNNDAFVWGSSRALESLDVSQVSYDQSFQLMVDVYQTLTEVNDEGELINGMASEITSSEDGKTYTITLRDDAKWVDYAGEEQGNVTAEDYVYGWQRMVTPATASSYSFIFEPIVNATEITAGEKEPSELGVKAIDDYTLEVSLNTPVPYFESLLAFPSFTAQPKAAIEEYGTDYASDAEHAWYDGAYYVTEYDPQSETYLTKNELYYDKDTTTLENITFKVSEDDSASYSAFKTGELDYAEILSNSENQKEAKEEGTLKSVLTGFSYYVHLNHLDSATTANENLRKGIAYGFDREEIRKAAFGDMNEAVEYILPAEFTNIAYDGEDYRDYGKDSLITYNKEEADKYFDAYMEDMGFSERSEIVVKYLAADTESNRKLSEAVQAAYSQTFGITIKVDTLPSEQFDEARENGEYDMLILAWGPDFADPSTYLGLWTSYSSQNDTGYNNPEYDALYQEALKETNTQARFEDFAKLEQMLIDDTVLVPFYQKTQEYLLADGYDMPTHLFMKISQKYVTKSE